jgi:hypothetical protein
VTCFLCIDAFQHLTVDKASTLVDNVISKLSFGFKCLERGIHSSRKIGVSKTRGSVSVVSMLVVLNPH